ncbi:hypothetical protein BHM03_00062933 [Ensete ventricosum]|nr:hypothetical protein BHM03_00062933 [Ensete ventricosum]
MDPRLHIFFFPLMAAGHIIPMVDIARLFVGRGVKATLLAPAPNPPLLLEHCVKKARDLGQHIDLLLLPVPPSPTASPERPESPTFLTSPAMSLEFFRALEHLREPLERALGEHRPSCIISDMFLPWTADAARRLGIPRLVFHGMGFFPLCVLDSLDRHVTGSNTRFGDSDVVVVPGLPHPVSMKRSQLHDSVETRNDFSAFMERITESEIGSHGAVVNSFYEMEADYVDHYRDVIGRKAWHIGPVSLWNRDADELAGGRGASDNYRTILTWLDSKPSNSVVYVCFGSLCHLTAAQLHQLGFGLEASGHGFLWVINGDEQHLGGREEKVEERGKGLIVRGWGPQRPILNHRAVGAFMTHCGWNSVVEAVSAGVPMITWPMFAEQFYNEKLVVQVLRVGVSVGPEVWGMEEEKKPVVGGAAIAAAVAQLMDGGGEVEDGMRKRAAELKQKARDAVGVGGSSYLEIDRLIHELSISETDAVDSGAEAGAIDGRQLA